MGYQPRNRSPRSVGRGYGTPRHKKARARGRKHTSIGRSKLEENHVVTIEEFTDKTLKRLLNLGNQTFASSPYSEHFGRWLMNLTGVLSEFESSPTISADDQFVRERSQILSIVELKLEERCRKEASLDVTMKSLSNNKILLEHIEKEHATRIRNIEGQKNSEIKRLYDNIDSLRGELNTIARMKSGIFRAISKKAKAQKETETTQRLNTAQKELELAILNFTAEQEKLRNEYERKKQPIIEQIREHQKEIKNLETDGSLEDRQVACEALVNAINALLQRKMFQLH
jgi:hypothetical protein